MVFGIVALCLTSLEAETKLFLFFLREELASLCYSAYPFLCTKFTVSLLKLKFDQSACGMCKCVCVCASLHVYVYVCVYLCECICVCGCVSLPYIRQ